MFFFMANQVLEKPSLPNPWQKSLESASIFSQVVTVKRDATKKHLEESRLSPLKTLSIMKAVSF